ncbi:armadillo-type protein [Gautieria morchelliformis]|nr:armadillo-type protein [Gautieria morchelliformis]
MISVQLDSSATPPPSNSRLGISLESAFSSAVPTSAPPAIIAPKPLRPNPSDHHPTIQQQSQTRPSAPSPPPLDPNVSYSRHLATGVPASPTPDPSLEIYVDDEGLSSVEKIYLFCRSTVTMHRVFISRSLHTFLKSGVSPLEGVEYVLPLLNGLAVDDEDAVKEALVSNLVDIMWWFFENCRLVEEEPPLEGQEDPPLLPVQSFTPILGSLLIDHSAMVGAPARFAVVEILNRLHSADDKNEDSPPFAAKERKMLEQEIVHQVIIGMGRLDVSEENCPSPIFNAEMTPEFPPTISPPSATDKNMQIFLPPLQTESQPSSSSTLQPEASDSVTDTCTASLASHPHSSGPSSSLDSLPGPTYPLSQGLPSQAPLDSAPPALLGDCCDRGILLCSHRSSEGTAGESAQNKALTNVAEGWLVAEAQQCQDTQDEANEQAAVGRLSSMSLIATVTAHAKLPEDTIRAFADEVAYIGADPLCWVRREASFAVGALAKVVPVEVVLLSLLPLFEALASDTVWQVRHSAVFALPGILTRLTPQHRRTLALDVLLSLSGDVETTVRSAVLEVLGEVIYAFHTDDGGAPPELVSLFVGRHRGSEWHQHKNSTETQFIPRTDPKKPPRALSSVFENDDDLPEGSEAAQSEPVGKLGLPPAVTTTPSDFFQDPARSLITSFNYPAVALSLGPYRWGEVREHYLTLTRDRSRRVRRTIAAGLGEMARILGSTIAGRDLLDAWQDMVHDAEDGQTRLKTLGGVCSFVGALEGPVRAGLMMGFVELWERWLTGWRERECLTLALPDLALLADEQGEVVRTLMGKALVDKMAAVREAAIGGLTHILRAFESRPHLAETFRDDLRGLASVDFCRKRATYVACCRALVEGEQGKLEVAKDEFWEHIVPLSQDKVTDVRIGVARLLGIVCDKFYPQPSSRSPRLKETIRRLSRDPSRDVRSFVAFLLVPEEASQLRHSPTRSATPPVVFATFSRPPRKTPPVILEVDLQDTGDEDYPMELTLPENQPRVRSPTMPEQEPGPIISPEKGLRNEDKAI